MLLVLIANHSRPNLDDITNLRFLNANRFTAFLDDTARRKWKSTAKAH
jgi:hypothetical protein